MHKETKFSLQGRCTSQLGPREPGDTTAQLGTAQLAACPGLGGGSHIQTDPHCPVCPMAVLSKGVCRHQPQIYSHHWDFCVL